MGALRFVVLAVLGALLAAPASARAGVVSDPDGVGAALVSNGKVVLATWHVPAGDRMRLVARLLGRDGTPLGPARRFAESHSLLGGIDAPSLVWNPRRKRFLAAFGLTGAKEARKSCATPNAFPYSLPNPNCVQGDIEIYTREFDARGKPLGRPRRVTSTGPASSLFHVARAPVLAPDSRGALLTYDATVDGPPISSRMALRVDGGGKPTGKPRRVMKYSVARIEGTVRALPGGGAIMVFSRTAKDGRSGDLYAQRLGRDGALRGRRVTLDHIDGVLGSVEVTPNPATGRTLVLWDKSAFMTAPGLEMVSERPTSHRHVLGRGGRAGTTTSFELAHLAGDADLTAAGRGWAALYTRWIAGDGVLFSGASTSTASAGRRSG